MSMVVFLTLAALGGFVGGLWFGRAAALVTFLVLARKNRERLEREAFSWALRALATFIERPEDFRTIPEEEVKAIADGERAALAKERGWRTP